MGRGSKIEWCHHTFNLWWGCDEVSPACANCYAREQARRYGWTGKKDRPELWGADEARRFFGDKHWDEPLRWDREAAAAGERHRVFAESMGDLFEDRDDLKPHRARFYGLVRATPNLDWLLLTKRIHLADRLWTEAQYQWWDGSEELGPTWGPNVWIGTTVEDQPRANLRLPHLALIPAAVTFVSMEPLVGAVDLRQVQIEDADAGRRLDAEGAPYLDALRGATWWPNGDHGANVRPLDWIIVGGETGGLKTRPMHLQWVRYLREDAKERGIPFFFKQHGEWIDVGDAHELAAKNVPSEGHERIVNLAGGHGFHGAAPRRMRHAAKATAGRVLDGRTWDEFPKPRSA